MSDKRNTAVVSLYSRLYFAAVTLRDGRNSQGLLHFDPLHIEMKVG